ncbi:MAG: transglycosylase domain-containing protein [Defluviitaleaceae bacterium]|nr:transglycosylase domain-containing protein [Defluviitaleaceae bacterium]
MDYTKTTNKRRKRRHHPNAARLKNTIGILIFRVVFAVILIGGFAAAGAGIGAYLGVLRNAPEIDIRTDLRSETHNSFIFDNTGREIVRLSGDENREFVPINRMPQHLQDAFVAIEDERFFTHNGVDIRGVGRALHTNLTSDRVEGASTITQQLIKNILGLHRNDLISKLQEQYLAVQFERALAERYGSTEIAKEVILEAYLNMINLGRNWHGVQVAAWNYFGKDVSELTLSESAVIAAITRNPSRYLPDRFPEHNRYRQLLVLDNMLRLEMINEREHRQAVNDPVHERVLSGLIAENAHGVVHSYFVDAAITQVVEDLVSQHFMTREQAFRLVYSGGLEIHLTQDMQIQGIVDDVFEDDDIFPVDVFEIDIEYRLSARNEITGRVTNHLRTGTVRNYEQVQPWLEEARNELLTANDTILGENYILMPQPQAAFVLMDQHNGHVLAISGGRGEKTGNRHFCRATEATRSPGSQFKVVAAFLPGVDLGIFSAATHIEDSPFTHDDGHSPPYTPRNWWGNSWEGYSSVRRAIYRSMNVVSVKAFYEVGGEVAFNYLRNLGFTTLDGTLSNGQPFRDTHLAVPLGGLTLGVTQLELAGSYAAIANLGEFNRPVFYTRVLDHEGNILLENGHNPTRVIRAPAAYLLTDMMRDTVRGVAGATGGNANFRNLRMPIAGKTGTSQNTVDLGFTGYTPYFTASIWLGFDQQQRMRGLDRAHLEIWRTIMERVHVELELPHREFQRPDGVTTGSICMVSRKLPTDLCRSLGRVATDLFVVGTLPSAHCEPEYHMGEHGYPSHYVEVEQMLCTISGQPISGWCPPEFWEFGSIWMPPDGEEGMERCFVHSLNMGEETPEDDIFNFPGDIPPSGGILDDDDIMPGDINDEDDSDDSAFYLPDMIEPEDIAPNLPAPPIDDEPDLDTDIDLDQLLPPTLTSS